MGFQAVITSLYEYEIMAKVEKSHWWYRTLHHLVLDTLERHFNSKEIRVVDAGCGTGGLLQKLTTAGYRNSTGFDVSEHAIAWCERRGLPVTIRRLTDLDSFNTSEKYDAIISNDTLYYLSLPEQTRFFDSAFNRLGIGGIFIMNLPALNSFRGTHDIAVGIRHRFSHIEIGRAALTSGFEIVSYRYWPFLLSPIIYAVRKLQRFSQSRGAKKAVKSDLRLHSAMTNHALYYLTSLELIFPLSSPFGSSLFVVLRKSLKHPLSFGVTSNEGY